MHSKGLNVFNLSSKYDKYAKLKYEYKVDPNVK